MKAAYVPPRLFFIILLCVGTVIASTIFGFYLVTREQAQAISIQTRLRNETIGNLAIASSTLVWDLNEVALQDALMAQMNLPDLLGVRVYQGPHDKQQLFAEVRKTGFNWEEGSDGKSVFRSPLLRGTREIGRIEVAFNENFLSSLNRERIRDVLLQNLVIALVLGSLVLILALQKRAQRFLEAKSEELAGTNRELEEEIQERKVLEQNLRQSRDEARLANKVKQEFLANMSHELRTPLNGILGLTRLLGEGQHSTPEERECFALLRESGESLQTHLDDILTYTSLETGKLSLRASEFDLPVLLQEIAERMKIASARKGLQCEITTGENLPGRVQGDRQELQRSTMALIHNAIKFSPKDKVWLEMKWDAVKPGLRVQVRDSGPGVPKESEEKIYQPFVQLDASASRRFSGLGLGLALASKVVNIAGGSVRCLNPGEPGALFEMIFPLRPLDKSLAASLDENVAAETAWAANFRILIVDDNDLNRRVLRLLLTKAGTPCEEAASGQEALQLLQQQNFDLVFMDVQMPEMDGLEATRLVRAGLPPARQPFVIALTAHALPSDRQLCLDAGMDEYLAKPVEVNRLLRWIERLQKLPPDLRCGLSATRKDHVPPASGPDPTVS